MKSDTMCFIVDFDEYTRQACLESLSSESFSTITVYEKEDKISKLAWATTIGFARQIRGMGRTQGKRMTFKVVVARKCGKLRFAKASEWIVSIKKRSSIARTVSTQIAKIQTKKLVRGRLGTV